MIHLGDITKITGGNVPVVDCIIGGSPCQDLSIAGKRLGLSGAHSSLFLEQIRIVKEMRAHDQATGRTGSFIRPRFFVWENVAGALSTNRGEDFRIVLEEIAQIADKRTVIPRPQKQKWRKSGCILGDWWSVAWRIFDAQFWGVPQRRRRIALVADFAGHAAPEILFERKSVRGHPPPSRETGKNPAGSTEIGFNPAISLHLTQDPISAIERTPCLSSGNASHGQATIGVLAFSGGQRAMTGGLGIAEECAPRLKAADSRSNRTPVALGARDQNAVCLHPTVAGTLLASGAGTCRPAGPGNESDLCIVQPVLCIAHGQSNAEALKNLCPTLNCNHEQPILVTQTVRRLTPLECERLQGYPDGWTDIGAWTDSKGRQHKESSDSARYKSLGNSIALPPWKWVLKRLCAQYERDATMASLFDGIGGFPFLWEQLNGKDSCLWASEIEEFPITVTKYHFSPHTQE